MKTASLCARLRRELADNERGQHMKSLRVTLMAGLVAAVSCSAAPASASQDKPNPTPATPNLSGLRDFDFLFGEWHVRHRLLKADSHKWVEFDGSSNTRKLMEGWGNVEDNVLNRPGGSYRAVGLRSYDSKTGQWAIWWLDGRSPFGPLDPPVKGRFENGIGNFYSDDTLDGKPIRVRYTWSHITPTSARWEQAYSPDAGKTWETNWIMEFQRAQ
jgi:hypothetical protein